MNRLFAAIFVMSCFGGSAANAMDGVFDREAEVQSYLLVIGTKTNNEVTNAAKNIYSSGISDDRLAKALNDRLLNDYGALAPPKGAGAIAIPIKFIVHNLDDDYGIWMSRALSSFGLSEYAPMLKRIKMSSKYGGVKSDRVRMAANAALERIDWHKRKNETMSSRKLHQPGDDEHSSQLMNLPVADDPTFRHFALDRISQEKNQDLRIYKTLEEQVAHHIDNPEYKANRKDDNLIAVNIKLLGLSGNAQYRAVLERVLTSNAVPGLKKHAGVALKRLREVT